MQHFCHCRDYPLSPSYNLKGASCFSYLSNRPLLPSANRRNVGITREKLLNHEPLLEWSISFSSVLPISPPKRCNPFRQSMHVQSIKGDTLPPSHKSISDKASFVFLKHETHSLCRLYTAVCISSLSPYFKILKKIHLPQFCYSLK